MDQAVSLAARSRRFESSFYPCKVNLNTRHVGALRPHTHQPSPSIPWQQIRAHRLGVQCPTDPDWPSCSGRTCTHHNRNGRPRLRSREGICLRAGSLRMELRDALGTTFVIVSHELASIFAIASNGIYLDVRTRRVTARATPPNWCATRTPNCRPCAF